jgi:hypothetical protein
MDREQFERKCKIHGEPYSEEIYIKWNTIKDCEWCNKGFKGGKILDYGNVYCGECYYGFIK